MDPSSQENEMTEESNDFSAEQLIAEAFKFHSQGNISEAAKYYQYFIDKGFKDHRVFSNYGSILQGLGKLKEAEIYTRKAVELNPNFANAHSNLGNILRDLGNLQNAELSTRKAIALNPNFANAYSNLGGILIDMGRLKEAEIYTRKAIELNPNSANAHSNLGNLLRNLGNLQNAELSTRKAIALNPNLAITHSNLGSILIDMGRLKEAEISIRKAIRINPNLAIAYANLGTILRDLDKLKEAEISTRKAIALNPNLAITHSNLGSILIDMGRLKEAEISIRKAIRINPNLANAHLNLGSILIDLGKLTELIDLSQSTLESKSIHEEKKLGALLHITIASLLQKDFSRTLLSINQINELKNKVIINNLKNEDARRHISTFSRFITSLYPQLEKKKDNHISEKLPHFGESHCLSFAHQNLYIDSRYQTIQPVLITGAKAWHFANKINNRWKDSLTQQIKNHTYNDQVFISFGEIDCRKDEGILPYTINKDKDMSEVCDKTIQGFLDHMELKLSPHYSKRYYFGIPAPTRTKELPDELDKKRIEIIKIYNSIFKKAVLSRGSYFLDIYELTSNKNGENNNIYMCDNTHLSPKCLSILFENFLYKS